MDIENVDFEYIGVKLEDAEYGPSRTELYRRGVVRLSRSGLTTKQIADKLSITTKFVEYLLTKKENKEI